MKEKMIFIINALINYLILILLIHFGWKTELRKQRVCWAASLAVVLAAGLVDFYFNQDVLWVYLIWSVVSMWLLFDEKPISMLLRVLVLIFFTGMVDVYSTVIVQILIFHHAVDRSVISWWMFLAYPLSLVVYALIYFGILKRTGVYLSQIHNKYKAALLFLMLIFEWIVLYVFDVAYSIESDYNAYMHFRFLLCLVGVFYSVFITIELANRNYLFNRKNAELIRTVQIQEEQYDYQKKTNMDIRRFKHDISNHMGILAMYLTKREYDKAEAYAKQIIEVADTFSKNIKTGDENLDVVLNHFAYACEKKSIPMQVRGQVGNQLKLNMIDLTTLVGNIMQNAIEASENAVEPNIAVCLSGNDNEVFVTVRNRVDSNKKPVEGFITTKKDTINHGFGIINIKDIVTKYGGECYLGTQEVEGKSFFCVEFSLPRG